MAKSNKINHDEQLFEEFLIESGGSYDMQKFSKWYRKRLYSEKGLKLLESKG
ncbi:MAG: hypothetical protein HYX20_04285 [Candidatus Yanofskybacteria bacterium]|nr:hypothetical protein [Candidatus Yanofskybacteria bacterium]